VPVQTVRMGCGVFLRGGRHLRAAVHAAQAFSNRTRRQPWGSVAASLAALPPFTDLLLPFTEERPSRKPRKIKDLQHRPDSCSWAAPRASQRFCRISRTFH